MAEKELSQEQLEKVTGGGSWGEEHAVYLPADHGVHVAATEAYKIVGKDVYIVDDGYPYLYCWGLLTSSNGSFHSITIKGKSKSRFDGKFQTTNVDIGNNYSFIAAYHTLFLYKKD